MSEQEDIRYTKQQLVQRINQSYQAFEEVLRPLTEEQLTRPDESGWAIKDHLAHIAAWELGVAELLAGGDRFAAMQVDDPRGRPVDEINDQIYRKNAHLTPDQALDTMRAAHRRFMQVLETLSDDDLYKPYRAYLPEGQSGPEEPIINWITGDTFDHYEEHTEWIQKGLE
jgi:hypothetical protein